MTPTISLSNATYRINNLTRPVSGISSDRDDKVRIRTWLFTYQAISCEKSNSQFNGVHRTNTNQGDCRGMDGAPVCMWLINCNWIDWKGVEWMDLSFTLGLVQFVAESCWFICFCVLSDRIGEGGWMNFDDLHGTLLYLHLKPDTLIYWSTAFLPCYCEYPCQQDDQNTRNEFVSFLKLHHLHNDLSDIQEMFSLKVPS